MIKTIKVPICKEHTTYRGIKDSYGECIICEAIWSIKHQDEFCACEFNSTLDCAK